MDKDPKSRRGYINEARRVAGVFLRNNLQTIVFAQSRLNTEVLLTYLKEDIETAIQNEGLVRGYRGGYFPLKRREIEKGLREGKILGVVSTNALELPFGDGETFGKQEGCPSCVGPSRETGRQAKQVAQEILRGLLEE